MALASGNQRSDNRDAQEARQKCTMHSQIVVPFESLRLRGWRKRASPDMASANLTVRIWAHGDSDFLSKVDAALVLTQQEPPHPLSWTVHSCGLEC